MVIRLGVFLISYTFLPIKLKTWSVYELLFARRNSNVMTELAGFG